MEGATPSSAVEMDNDEAPDAAMQRFELELEFVQALANPDYLHHLAQNLYFDDPAFRDYLVYLQYWRELPYCLHIVFPHCLQMLELLVQDDGFVDALKRADFKEFIKAQQFHHWRYRATKLGDTAVVKAEAEAEAEAQAADAAAGAARSAEEDGGTKQESEQPDHA